MATISEIHALATDPNPAAVPLESLRAWFADSDAEIQGAAFALVTNRPSFPWAPSLDVAMLDGLARTYFERRIRNDDGGRWAHSRYEAAWDLAGWVARYWFGDKPPPAKREAVVDWLGGLYTNGDAEVRRAVVDGTLEHLFERKDIKSAFKKWKNEPELGTAYAEANQWAAGGGSSPMVRAKPGQAKRKG
ncbi:hypothetical protein [Anaeromyxobacter oryzisoli]|uniref:hypothetical protein n=1 Tax=Anaeromyxobacter oryzisoli TaxID=2925408 RepID=UPI001F561F4B|nr:hypothetical protein [Anaeromyxobacter sp. SG63]